MRLPFLTSLCFASASLIAAPVDFTRDIKPIFDAHCTSCHGPEKQKSDYRLDSRTAALVGGESGEAAIVPGKPEVGSLLHLVDGTNEELFMPPRKSDAKPLSTAQIATLRLWIAEGAAWPETATVQTKPKVEEKIHWSFLPLKKPAVPGASINPVDAFIRAKLSEHGLSPLPEADRRTLIRRVSYDLTGLPPTLDEVQAFCADSDPKAYEKLVDRLLASPRHGERWARHWLDVVHYGETHGYDKDQPRMNAWPYRDYVIRAFNSDKPYSRFVQEQVAGDVLFPGTVDGVTALGFIAAGPWDLIGHAEVPETKIDGKIARHLDRDDMVSNTINTFQSVTAHCAQCHDHKFDPIKQADYYALQAVFAAVDRTQIDFFPDDETMQKFAAAQKHKKRLLDEIAALEAPLKKKAGEAYAALSKRIDAPAANANPNAKPDFGYHSAISRVQEAVKWVQVDLGSSQSVQRIVLKPCYDDFAKIGGGFGFPVRFKIEVSDDPEFKEGVSLVWRKHDATFMNDFANPGLTPFETGTAEDDGVTGRYVRVTATKLATRRSDYIFALAEMEVYAGKGGPNLAAGRPVTALDSIEAKPRWRKTNLTDGTAPASRTSDDKQKLIRERDALLLAQADETTRQKLLDLRKQRSALPALPPAQKVYAAAVHTGSGAFKGTGAEGGKPRPIHILRRGDVKQPLEEAVPGAMSTIGQRFGLSFDLQDATSESARRAALAQWLTQPDNALTWRSIVNRVWHYHFGRGIVETPNDFGKMGAAPTHPELLDWLAVWFRDDAKGSLKALHKLIVMSETYRQESGFGFSRTDAAKAAATLDSDNTLLWRQNRRRLEAEAIRDSILAAAGKLDLTMGGPSFQDFVITHPQHSPHYEYQLADPEDPKIHRRSIYRFLVRSQQQPWMATLDCADPSMLVDRRTQTITPLQALAQLNNQLSIAMSQHFAARAGGQDVAQLFRIALQRDPTAAERDELSRYAEKHGLVNASRLVLNLNEFVFVD
jgi:mono/diheme cytochrome c family protein